MLTGGRVSDVPFGAPRSAVPLIVFVVLTGTIQPRLVLPGLGAAGRPAAVFAVLLFVWWVYARFLPHHHHAVRIPIRRSLVVYMITFLAAMAAGLDRGLPGIEQRSMDRALLITLGLGGVMLVAQDALRSVDDVERLVKWVVGIGAFGAAVGVIQFAFDYDLATRLRLPGLSVNAEQSEIATRGAVEYRRVRGMALHPIEYGVHLAMVLPLALHLAMHQARRSKWWWWSVALLAGGIPLSVSRSGILAIVIALLVYGFGLTWRERANAFVLTILGTLAFMTVTPGLLGTIKSLFLNINSDNSTTGRTEDYAAIGDYIDERPFLGRGPGTYVPSEYRTLDNQFLASLIETGWIGLLAMIWVLLAALYTARVLVRRAHTAEQKSLARALGAGVAVAPITFATFDALGFPIFAGTLVVQIGCLAALHRIALARTGGPDLVESAGTERREVQLA